METMKGKKASQTKRSVGSKPARTAQDWLVRQNRKILGKHYASKYRVRRQP
jgi:hypothetical protein